MNAPFAFWKDVEQLKPGMNAVVEMHVERLRDVISVPVQAIVQVDQETWCYVESGNRIERRDLLLGRTNDKFIHIQEGVGAGDRLVLNPMAIFDETQSSEISPDAGAEEAPEIPADALAAQDESAATGDSKRANSARRQDSERRRVARKRSDTNGGE